MKALVFNLAAVRPRHAILLSDLVAYMLALKDRRPDLAEQAKRAIREGLYYERN